MKDIGTRLQRSRCSWVLALRGLGGRFDQPSDRDVALAIVTLRRLAPPAPEVPPQGANWVNEVLNDPA
eukprot:3247774-Pyramimonas_sp.AAC.1